MGPDRLDKFIKKQLEDHTTPTDPDLLWQQIQAKQNEEEKPKRRFFFFWLFGAGLLILGTLGYFVFNQDSNLISDTRNQLGTIDNNETNDNASQTYTNDIVNTNNQANESTSTNTNTPTTSFENESPIVKSDITSEKTTTEATKNVVANNSPTNASTTPKNINIVSQVERNSVAVLIDDNAGLISNSSSSSNSTASTSPDSLSNSSLNSTAILENQNTVDIIIEKTNENPPVISKSVFVNITELHFFLDDMPLAKSFVDQQEESDSAPDYVDKDREDSGEKKWSTSMGLSFVYGKAPNRLSAASDSASQNYLQNRKDTETSLDAVRIGFDLRWQHKSGFYIKPGIEYEQINERFDYIFIEDYTIDEPEQVVAIYYAMDNSQSQELGEAPTGRRRTQDKEIYNRYHSIDIPMIFGYSSSGEKKLNWYVEAGASANVWFKARGEMLDTDETPIRLTNNAQLFKSQTGVSLIGSFGLSYQLTENWSTSFSPTIKHHLGSITSDQNLIDQKYTNLGLQIGLRYHW